MTSSLLSNFLVFTALAISTLDCSSALMLANPSHIVHRAVAQMTLPLLLALGIDNIDSKQLNLPNEAMAKIISNDITANQALATADFDRSIYSEDCQFQDEIDTYSISDYVRGTKALFDRDRSHVTLLGDIRVDSKEATFYFQEDLSFNIPLKPIVTLSGKVVLSRGENGLIVKSREYWDQSPLDVLKTVRLTL